MRSNLNLSGNYFERNNYFLYDIFRKHSVTILLLSLLFCGCTSTKKFTYLRDLDPNGTIRTPLATSAPEYKISVNDNLYVSIVSSNADMNKVYNPSISGNPSSSYVQLEGTGNQYINGFEVDAAGDLNLPLFHKIHAEGLTIEQLEKKIQEVASELLKDVTVKVKLLSFRVTVMGEVKSPGVYYNYSRDLNVLSAISMAGGMTDYSKLNNVLVVRPHQNASNTFTIDLNSKSTFNSAGFYLRPNDMVFVQPSKNKNIVLKLPLITVVLGTISSFLLLLNFLK